MTPWKFYLFSAVLGCGSAFAYLLFGIEKAIEFLIPALLSGEALAKLSLSERERIFGATFSWPAAISLFLAILSVLMLLAGRARKAQIRQGKI